jgi:RimJ/RimL family protein N-acetyltransferase
MYCIFDAKENKLIGTLEIREKNDKDPGQFGCWLNERYRGGGRIQEAIKLITNIYFRLTDVPLFTAHVRLWNKRSYRALLKAGFTDTGKFYYEDGKPTRYLLEFRRKK